MICISSRNERSCFVSEPILKLQLKLLKKEGRNILLLRVLWKDQYQFYHSSVCYRSRRAGSLKTTSRVRRYMYSFLKASWFVHQPQVVSQQFHCQIIVFKMGSYQALIVFCLYCVCKGFFHIKQASGSFYETDTVTSTVCRKSLTHRLISDNIKAGRIHIIMYYTSSLALWSLHRKRKQGQPELSGEIIYSLSLGTTWDPIRWARKCCWREVCLGLCCFYDLTMN